VEKKYQQTTGSIRMEKLFNILVAGQRFTQMKMVFVLLSGNEYNVVPWSFICKEL